MKLLAVGLALFAVAVQSFETQAEETIDLESIAQQINSRNDVAWTAGHNSYFDGMTRKQIQNLMGALQTPQHLQLEVKDITPLSDIPESFDPREKWPGCESLKEVRDQSTCGSCWAFGAVQAMSDRICIQSGQKNQTRISSEDLLSCCGSCGMGCNGGYPSAAWSYFKTQGIVTGWLYGDTQWCSPYYFKPCDHHTEGKYGPCGNTQPTPSCKRSCSNSANYNDDHWKAQTVYGIPSNVQKIQTELMTNGPIEVAFSVYDDFLTYKSGVYSHKSGKMLGGHAVKMMGWGVENGQNYWLIANSWNEGWGDKGFFKIRRGTNECGIQSQGVAGIVNLPKQEKEMLRTQ